MQDRRSISYRVASFMERRSGWIILSTIVITALLIILLLTMAPDENASENPSGQVFDLQDDIDDRFPPAFHSAGIIVEARGEDVLTQKALWELYQNTLLTFIVADNEKLGGGSLRIGTGGMISPSGRSSLIGKYRRALGETRRTTVYGASL